MKTITEIRRNNLKNLVVEHKTQKALSKAINKLPTQLSHIFNKNKKTGEYIRNIGNQYARDVEKELSLPHLWMDEDHDPTVSETANINLLDQILLNKIAELNENDKLLLITLVDEKLELNSLRKKLLIST